jgi:DNA-binding response OmpR family regulator
MEPEMRVLLAEDCDVLRRMLGEILVSRFNCEITEARTADSVVDFCASKLFDLVVLDVHLPTTEDVDIVGLIRDGVNCPVIVITGDGQVSSARTGTEVLYKPFTTAELIGAVTAAGFEEIVHE